MRRTTPTVRQGWLAVPESPQEPLISVGTAAWYAWLETASLFFYVGIAGTFTARKERRQRGGWYWKAYRTHQGTLARLYLGKTASLTQETLEQAAHKLAQHSYPAEPAFEHTSSSASVSAEAATRAHINALFSSEQSGQAQQSPESVPPEPLLSIKIVVPPLRPDLVVRTRLAAALSEARTRQLIVLSAPAGFGKTTLLTQWSAQSPWRVAWVSLEASENDPLRFWRYVITALEKVAPGIGQEALELGQSRPSPPIESVVTSLLNALFLLSQDVVLILDDYHLITDQSTHDSLVFFLDHLPPRLHLVIASRTDPPLPLARLRVRQQLFELRASDLRFTPEEVATFFTTNKPFQLSEEQIATLATSTEGWIAALHLAALSLQGCDDIPSFLRAFAAGTHRSLTDYLAEEVLQHQPPAVQTFLMQTALLDRLSAPLCAALLEADPPESGNAPQPASAQALLGQLEQANLFLLPLDAEQRWYRYHHLFAEFLRERMRRTDLQRIPVLHRRAATWYEGQGLLAEAIHHALAAGEFNQAARLICQMGETLINRSEVMLLRLWLEVLPDTLMRAHPQLCLFYAWSLATIGQYEQAETWLQAAERSLEDLTQETSAARAARLIAPEPLSEPEAQTLLHSISGEIAALRAHSAAFWGDVPASMRFAQQALQQLPEERLFLRGLSMLNLGIACWLSGDVLAATQSLSQARALGLLIHNTYVALLATCCLTQVQMVRGKRHLAFKTGREALRLASEEGGKSLPAAAYAYVGMGQICYEWNDLNTASYYLDEGIALSEQWGNGDMAVYGHTVLAQVKQAQGDTPGALYMLEQAEHAVHSYQQRPWIIAIMVAQQVRLALMQGNMEAINRWSQQAEQDYVVTFEEVTRARIHLALGQTDAALSLLERQAHLATASGRVATLLEIRLLQALAHHQRQDTDQAMQALEEALTLAEPEGYLRLFIDEGTPMQALLSLWLRHQRSGNPAAPRLIPYVKKVLSVFGSRFEEETSAGEPDRPEESPALRSSFSQREQEILRQLEVGHSNEAIATALVLEVSTVKWHLSRIYAKLQVQNRTQAVLQAKKDRLF